MKPFDLELITPDNVIFKGQVSSLIVPAEKGYMGVLAGHASFIGSLRAGRVAFDVQSESAPASNAYHIKEGFMEILSRPHSATKVSILAEHITSET
jgi:F-type H+-transporting ATPase subunit epsilon